jgi:pSer/pThr/pTyr-binding forkhead associated (FHA) protein
MVVCPKCNTKYPDGEKFCRIHGAALVPAGSGDIGSATNSGGVQGDAQVKKLRAELAQRDQRIAALQEELETTRRELQAIRAKLPPGETPISGSAESTDTETVNVGNAEAPAAPHLVCLRGSLEGKRFDIPKKGMLIGRKRLYAEQGGISIDNPLVSNPHAWVGIEKGKVVLRDPAPAAKKSTNGVYLDDEATEPVTTKELNPGDTFIIADQSVAKFEFRR